MSESDKIDWNETVLSLAAWAMGGVCLLGLWVFGYQAYLWLKYGEWLGLNVWNGLYYMGMREYPSAEWSGIQKIIDWFMTCSLGFSLLLAALAGWWGVMTLSEEYYDQKRFAAMRKDEDS